MIILADTTANIWTALPTALWVGLIAVILFILRRPLAELISHLVMRVRVGAPMKIGSVEFGAIRTEQHHVPAPIGVSSTAPEWEFEGLGCELSSPYEHLTDTSLSPSAMELTAVRKKYYSETRNIMLVHRLFQSTRPNQVYDVLIYLVPHDEGSLIEVTGVEYFFGRYWANKVFESYDRGHGFPILTSAYGTFLCCARVRFNDGTKQDLFRYIDFEMGAYAPGLTNKDDEPERLTFKGLQIRHPEPGGTMVTTVMAPTSTSGSATFPNEGQETGNND